MSRLSVEELLVEAQQRANDGDIEGANDRIHDAAGRLGEILPADREACISRIQKVLRLVGDELVKLADAEDLG